MVLPPSPIDRILPTVVDFLAAEIAHAGGREVCFVATVADDGTLTAARTVARGTPDMVLALPGVADTGEMLLHNHPDGPIEPSSADLTIAARLHDEGIGFGIIDNDVGELFVVGDALRGDLYVARYQRSSEQTWIGADDVAIADGASWCRERSAGDVVTGDNRDAEDFRFQTIGCRP